MRERTCRDARQSAVEARRRDHLRRSVRTGSRHWARPNLAGAFLASPWGLGSLAESGAPSAGYWPTWMDGLALSVVSVFRTPPANRLALETYVTEFLAAHPSPSTGPPPSPVSLAAWHDWPVPRIDSVAELAEWLELSDGQLEWLADVKGLERTSVRTAPELPLCVVPRRGGVPRVIEAPKLASRRCSAGSCGRSRARSPARGGQGFRRGRSVRVMPASKSARQSSAAGPEGLLRLGQPAAYSGSSSCRL